MMSHDENLFESIISLTEERDKHSLESTLIQTLSELIESDALILFRTEHCPSTSQLEVAISNPENAFQSRLNAITDEFGKYQIQSDQYIDECINTNTTVSIYSETRTRRLFPITVGNKVVGVLDIYNYRNYEQTKSIINIIIRVYSNFLGLLHDNEHDTLTGLLNRRTFESKLSGLVSHAATINQPTTQDVERRALKGDVFDWVGVLDVDHFKSINDNYGHIYGDEVLLLLSNLMKKMFRNHDLLFRYGGEEFIVVLTKVGETDAFNVFERFRQSLEKFHFPQVGTVTASIGLAKIMAGQHTSSILEQADQALYYAKEHGRNQVYNYHTLVEQGKLTPREVDTDIALF